MKFYQKTWFIWLMLIFIAPVGIVLLWTQKKYNPTNRVILSVIFLVFFILVVPKSNEDNKNSEHVAIENENNPSQVVLESTQEEHSTADNTSKSEDISRDDENIDDNQLYNNLEKIELTYELQDILDKKQKVVIWITNNSDKILSGNLRIDIKSRENHILAIDSFLIDDLKPGQKKYVIMMADTTYPVDNIAYSWSDVEFTESPIKEANKTLDVDATKELTDDVHMNFGGAGNPEYKTSWYDYIEKIEVYTDGKSKWAVITISTKDPNKSNSIGRAILYTPDYLSKVILIDEKQNKISEIYK